MSAPAATSSNRTTLPLAAARGEVPTAALSKLVQSSTRRWRAVLLLQAVSAAVAVPLLFLLTAFGFDNWLHFSPPARVLLAFVGLLIAGRSAWNLIRRARASRLSEDQIALAIESRTPGGLQNRLINALQLARDRGRHRADLASFVVEENCNSLQRVALAPAARWRPAVGWLIVATAVIAVGLAYGLWQPALFVNAASRIFLPLADIQPLYRTTLDVRPGDIEAVGDVEIVVKIAGDRPAHLTLHRVAGGKRSRETIAVPLKGEFVRHRLHDVRESTDYAVSGGDFTSRYYRIAVPEVARLVRVEATYHYPQYMRIPPQHVEQSTGDLNTVAGAEAALVFHLNLEADDVELVVERHADRSNAAAPVPLTPSGNRAFAGQLAVSDAASYSLGVRRATRAVDTLGPFAIRAMPDAEPKLELRGLESVGEVQIDSVLPVAITAVDDFGLKQVELCYRNLSQASEAVGEVPWVEIESWTVAHGDGLKKSHNIACELLAAAAGDRVEVALRARDHCPARSNSWTYGPAVELAIGGEGAELVRRYEQILKSQHELAALLVSHRAWLADETVWLRKLEQSDLRWDDPQNIATLHTAVDELRKGQESLRAATSAAAQAMVDEAGNLRIGLGLLADSEHVRLVRILDAVPARDEPQAKRAALADAATTQERVIRSLEEIEQEYAAFRGDWELDHMLPLAAQLAEQQLQLAEQSQRYAASVNIPGDSAVKVMTRRQVRIDAICQLVQPAFASVAQRLQSGESEVSAAFASGAKTLASDELKQLFAATGEAIDKANWPRAAASQTTIANCLQQICGQIRAAQAEAARKLLAALEKQAQSDAAAQAALEALLAGSDKSGVKDVADVELRDLMRVRDVVARKSNAAGGEELDLANAPLFDIERSQIERETDSGVRQNPYSLALGNTAEKTAALGVPPGLAQNQVKPFIQEEFDDLVGKLLDEADELHKNFETLNLSTNQNNDDPGEIQKQGGRINSTGAVAATGNKKPPTTNIGGVSRTGRQGARAHGMIADQEFINRRGRDQVQEGQETVADQEGRSRETMSEDPQFDTSTGVGGKRVDSENTNFSLADVGKWKDEFADRMEKPQAKHNIVERAGEPISAETAAMLRDLNSKQEQVIERLKVLRKELKNLYLPTEHLDELADQLATTLDSLKDRPDAEMFRLQSEQLQRLQGALRVFEGPGAGLEPSLPRERVLRGRVLDEPTSPVIPGYEEAVKQYFLNLAHE